MKRTSAQIDERACSHSATTEDISSHLRGERLRRFFYKTVDMAARCTTATKEGVTATVSNSTDAFVVVGQLSVLHALGSLLNALRPLYLPKWYACRAGVSPLSNSSVMRLRQNLRQIGANPCGTTSFGEPDYEVLFAVPPAELLPRDCHRSYYEKGSISSMQHPCSNAPVKKCRQSASSMTRQRDEVNFLPYGQIDNSRYDRAE